jgi:hypothetical protein
MLGTTWEIVGTSGHLCTVVQWRLRSVGGWVQLGAILPLAGSRSLKPFYCFGNHFHPEYIFLESQACQRIAWVQWDRGLYVPWLANF